jgi:hypothetical protein
VTVPGTRVVPSDRVGCTDLTQRQATLLASTAGAAKQRPITVRAKK